VDDGLPGVVMRSHAKGPATEPVWVNRSTSVELTCVIR